MVLKKLTPGRGYTKEDWDAVDSPELTDEQLSQPLTFEQAFPGYRRTPGRPRVESPKKAVTLRLDPEALAKFETIGPDWRRRMAELIEQAAAHM